jgi:hypothetical protein
MEWLAQFIELINDNAGVIAVFSFVAAIVVPIVIYRMQRQDAIRDAKQDAQDQLDAMNEVSRFSFTEEGRKHYAKKGYLQRKIKR